MVITTIHTIIYQIYLIIIFYKIKLLENENIKYQQFLNQKKLIVFNLENFF